VAVTERNKTGRPSCESLDGDGHQRPGHPRRNEQPITWHLWHRTLKSWGEVPISEATSHLDEVANESAATGEVIYLTRGGRRLAAIVPVEVAAGSRLPRMPPTSPRAQAAMAEPGEDIPAEGVWAELGIADDQIGHRSEVYDR
jgi:hypothetical protein